MLPSSRTSVSGVGKLTPQRFVPFHWLALLSGKLPWVNLYRAAKFNWRAIRHRFPAPLGDWKCFLLATLIHFPISKGEKNVGHIGLRLLNFFEWKKIKCEVLLLASLILERIYIKNAVNAFHAVSRKNLFSFGIYYLPFFLLPCSQALSSQMTPPSCSPLRLATTDNTSDYPHSPSSRCTWAVI